MATRVLPLPAGTHLQLYTVEQHTGKITVEEFFCNFATNLSKSFLHIYKIMKAQLHFKSKMHLHNPITKERYACKC